MKIVIAPDSFKGSLSAPEAARAIKAGLARVWPEAEYCLFPVADGGEGTVAAMTALTNGQYFFEKVLDPLGREVEAAWGLLGDGRTAVVETASCSGLTLLGPEELNPAAASTYGLGQLINKILAHDSVKRLLVGLGGSATNDAGAGLLAALGAELLDRAGRPIPPGGLGLEELDRIEIRNLNSRLAEVEITVASDVQNPLTGPDGASAVFGPQKGAGPELAGRLDRALSRFADRARRATGRDMADRPGAGAAGGLGAAFLFFTRAGFRPGVEVVLEEGRFLEQAAGADLVITGEGRSDRQTAWGKAPAGVAALARRLGAPVALLSGALGEGYQELYHHNIAAMMSLAPGPLALQTAMAEAAPLLEEAAERLARLLSLKWNGRRPD